VNKLFEKCVYSALVVASVTLNADGKSVVRTSHFLHYCILYYFLILLLEREDITYIQSIDGV
jgi:hypothetical protein